METNKSTLTFVFTQGTNIDEHDENQKNHVWSVKWRNVPMRGDKNTQQAHNTVWHRMKDRVPQIHSGRSIQII